MTNESQGSSGDLHDLVVRGGTLATARRTENSDIAVRDGQISQVGGQPRGRKSIDAHGLVVTPGGIDMHVHLTQLEGMDVPVRPDDFASGSRAAANGGITTIGNMTHQRDDMSFVDAVSRVRDVAAVESLVDFYLHPVLRYPSPQSIAELEHLAKAGYGSLKIFMAFDDFDQRYDDYVAAIEKAARLGMLVLIHAEDWPSIKAQQSEMVARGRLDSRFYPESRPVDSEVTAVERAISISEMSGARILIVHLSSASALTRCVDARADGVPVHVETRPMYLFLTDAVFEQDRPERYVGNPPPRSDRDRRSLWAGLRSGAVDILSSDHAPWTLDQKMSRASDVRRVLPGVAELDSMLPMFFSEGVVAGRLTLPQFVRASSTGAAHLFGLYPGKGSLEVGADADLTIWDPAKKWVVDASRLETAADYSPYEGWEVTGSVMYTLRSGELVKDPSGPISDGSRGRFVRGPSPGIDREPNDYR